MIRPMGATDTLRTRMPAVSQPQGTEPEPERCDYCGSTDLVWVRCKLVCRNCKQINKSCADL